MYKVDNDQKFAAGLYKLNEGEQACIPVSLRDAWEEYLLKSGAVETFARKLGDSIFYSTVPFPSGEVHKDRRR